MKFLIVGISLSILCVGSAYAEDYRLGNDNPFVVYNYNPQVDANMSENKSNVKKQESKTDVNYFSNTIKSPVNYLGTVKSEYQHLLKSSPQLQGCWDKAGKTYNVDPWLLMAVAKVESSFRANAINKNKNNSYDIGMMQINSIWLPTLSKHGITSNDLLHPCTSVFVGSWIMAQNIKRFGYNQDGIGAYNSPGNITLRRKYAKLVYKAYERITTDFKAHAR